jgi:outer membrane protein assembly factor BamB
MSLRPRVLAVSVIVTAAIAVVLINLVLTKTPIRIQGASCQEPEVGIDISSNWAIKTPSNGKIAWAKQLAPDDYLLAASNNTVAFFRGATNDKCITGNQVIALDAVSGEKKWNVPIRLVRGLDAINDGYLITACCTSIIKIDKDGNQLWKSQEFPTKIYRPKIFVDQDTIYFPSDIGTFEISSQDGTLLESSRTLQVEGVFGDYQIVNADDKLLIRSVKDNTMLGEIPIANPSSTSISQLLFSKDTLLVVSNYDHIDAYDITSNKKVWELDIALSGDLVISDDRVIAYSRSNELLVYESATGNKVDSFYLEKKASQDDLFSENNGTFLAFSGNIVCVFFTKTDELIALKLN